MLALILWKTYRPFGTSIDGSLTHVNVRLLLMAPCIQKEESDTHIFPKVAFGRVLDQK